MGKGRKFKRGPLEFDNVTASVVQKYMSTNSRDLFRLDGVIDEIVLNRLAQVTEADIQVYDKLDGAVAGPTISWNMSQLLSATCMGRPRILINALMSIDYVYCHSWLMDVLCVGPRLEAEIFQFGQQGFNLERIRGLDLMSYSDFIDLGDMHAMPYADNSFDIVFLGWVLGYSAEPGRVAAEALRVCRPGGYIAVACTRPLTEEGGAGATYYYKVDDILQYFDKDQIRHVYLRHEPSDKMEGVSYVMTVFERT